MLGVGNGKKRACSLEKERAGGVNRLLLGSTVLSISIIQSCCIVIILGGISLGIPFRTLVNSMSGDSWGGSIS